jgi:hypothetical protein
MNEAFAFRNCLRQMQNTLSIHSGMLLPLTQRVKTSVLPITDGAGRNAFRNGLVHPRSFLRFIHPYPYGSRPAGMHPGMHSGEWVKRSVGVSSQMKAFKWISSSLLRWLIPSICGLGVASHRCLITYNAKAEGLMVRMIESWKLVSMYSCSLLPGPLGLA